MIVGSTIIYDGTGTEPYFTAPFRRRGQAAVFSFDVTHEGGSPTMTIGIEHKNFDEATWSSLATITSISATGVQTKDATDIKQQVRFYFLIGNGTLGDFFHVVVGAPSWRTYN